MAKKKKRKKGKKAEPKRLPEQTTDPESPRFDFSDNVVFTAATVTLGLRYMEEYDLGDRDPVETLEEGRRILALEHLGLTPRWREWHIDADDLPSYAHGPGSPTVLVAGRCVAGAPASVSSLPEQPRATAALATRERLRTANI